MDLHDYRDVAENYDLYLERMYSEGPARTELFQEFYLNLARQYGGDGIVVTGVENTIRAVSTIARDGMRSTDREVIRLMMANDKS